MKVAQIIIVKQKSGDWKLIVMSLKQTEILEEDLGFLDVPNKLVDFMQEYEWEQLS